MSIGQDYADSKSGLGAVAIHDSAIDVAWDDIEPLVTPQDLRILHLFGIPLISAIRNPLIGKPDVIDDDQLKKYIIQSVSLAEMEGGFDIFPRQYVEKHAFDKAAYDSFSYMMMRHRPVSSIEALTVTPSNEQNIFQVPNEWIDIGYLHQGQINLIPLTIALKSGTLVPLSTAPGGATFLSIFGHRPWIPSFWEVRYTAGFKDQKIPRIVNQLIGVIAAMEVLSMLATTYARATSTSLGIDGLSQSISTPGPEIFSVRLGILGDKRKWLIKKIQRSMNLGFIVDNV